MKYQYHKPNSLLTDHVQTILVLEDLESPEISDLPLFTNGMSALLCEMEEGNANRITLFGKSIPAAYWTNKPNTKLIAFFFKPFALGTIFKLSAQELKEEPITLRLWNAQIAIALDLQLLYAKSTLEKLEILNHFILSQFLANQRHCEIIKFATDKMIQNPSLEVIPTILKELNITERTFQRIFKCYLGITANQYRRICQFHFSFSQLKGKGFEKLTDVAYENGYFDQSHYIRSFKAFTKTTPKDYLKFGLTTKKK